MASIMEDQRDEPKSIDVAVSEVKEEGSQWTAVEERRVRRKLDTTILPLMALVFFFLQLDRGNIGSAASAGLADDIGITQAQYNIGIELQYIGIVILEIPSNFLLYRVGPRLWLGGQIVAWGMVATFQAFQSNAGSFYATRFLLGCCEAGFIPGCLFVLSSYYKNSEISKRFAIYFLGSNLAQACSGLMAYGILQMDGVSGLFGWQWVFLLEGLMTITGGLIFLTLLPKSPDHPRNYLGLFAPTEREAWIARQRVLDDDVSKARTHPRITLRDLTSTLSNWRIYPHILISMCGIAPVTTLGAYGPTLIKSFGYGTLTANALSSVGPWIQIPLSLGWGWLADRTQRRGWVSLAGLVPWWAFALGSLILCTTTHEEARYAMLTLAFAFCTLWHPLNGSWLSQNSRSPAERAITMALFVMAANMGGVIGGQLFQTADGPDYQNGWTAIVCLISVSIFFNLFSNLQYRVSNRRLAKNEMVVADPNGEKAEGIEGWRYSL